MTGFLEFISAEGGAGAIAMLLIKSSLVICIGLFLWFALRRSSASARHLVLGATMAAILLLPVISVIGPELPLPVIAEQTNMTVGAVPRLPADATTTTAHNPVTVLQPIAVPPNEPVNPMNVIFAAYFFGAAAVFIYVIAGIARVWWFSRNAVDITDEFDWQQIGDGQTAPVRILASQDVPVPLTWGIYRPKILLPACATGWSDAERRHAIFHELAHVRRRDWIVQIVGRANCAVYWFNPLVWLTLRQLTFEAELAADDEVLKRGAVPHDYADQLLSLARNSPRIRLPIAGTTMVEQSMLGRRVHAILNSGGKNMTTGEVGNIGILTIIAVSTLIVGSATLVAAPQSDLNDGSLSSGNEVSTPLIRAAARGRRDEVLRLINQGADIDETSNARGRNPELARTALVAAARFGHLDVVQTLLDAGAPIDRVVPGDETALIAALRANHIDVARLLIKRGADANLGVRGDGSALIAAAANGNAEAVRLLLDNGADPNLSISGDENPLYHAAASRNEEVFDMLVEAGADIRMALEDVASAAGTAE